MLVNAKKWAKMEPIRTPLGTKIFYSEEQKMVRLSDSSKRRIETGIKHITYDKKNDSFEVLIKPIKTSDGCNLESCYIDGKSAEIKEFFKELNNLVKCFGGNKAEAVLELVPRGIGISPNTLKKLTIIPYQKL